MASLPNSDQTVGPDDIPRRCVASPIAGSVISGSEAQNESKHGALSTESMISSLDVYNGERAFRNGWVFWVNPDDCD